MDTQIVLKKQAGLFVLEEDGEGQTEE